MAARPLKIGTRGSPLARWQATHVRDLLIAAHGSEALDIGIETISTSGDRIQDKALRAFGGKGLFTKEIEDALLDSHIDIAVHSMKDMPTVLPEGLWIACVLEREDPRDAFLSPKAAHIDDLPEGATVGTSSLRRQAQVRRRRPDLKVETFRGNVDTRLRKLEEGVVDATLLACAGLNRLDIAGRATAILDPEIMLPAVSQGIIGIEIRETDEEVRDLLHPLEHAQTRTRLEAERAFLAALDGSCHTPIAAYAELDGDTIRLRGEILLPDGSQAHACDVSGRAGDAASLGTKAGLDLKHEAGPAFMAKLEQT